MTQQPPGWDPYGQPRGGQDPYGQQPYGADPYYQPTSYGEVVPYQPPDYHAPVPTYQVPMQPMWANPPAAKTNGLAIASMVCSLVGLVFCYFAAVLQILALVFGLVAKNKIKQTGQGGGGMATAGIVISAIVLGLDAVVVILSLVFRIGLLSGLGGLTHS